jgi:L,D-peptidoglycan transpeptidase YkuD (ErfK/YbiS/YcfS/YnhG family)
LHEIGCKKVAKSFARGPGEVKRGLNRLVATRLPRQAQAQEIPFGRFHAGPVVVRCAIGRAGIRQDKREGDRATPAGAFRLLGGFFRAERVSRKAWVSPMRPARPSDGWCDDPRSAHYNRRVVLPCRANREKLWRADRLYDLVIVLDYNIHPRRKNRGSAIFLHCARPDFAPTSGCIALRLDDLRRLLPRLSRKAVLTVR